MFGHEREVYEYIVPTNESNTVTSCNSSEYVTFIDYNYAKKMIYWRTEKSIKVSSVKESDRPIPNRPSNIARIGMFLWGTAYDWIHNNLYWTDLRSIYTLNADSRISTVVIARRTGSLTGVVADPRDGHRWVHLTHLEY